MRSAAAVSAHDRGGHVCWSFDDHRSFRWGLAGFVRDGLRSGQRLICSISASRLEDTSRDLCIDVPDARTAERDGSLRFEAARDAYAPRRGFDPDERLLEVRGLAARAIADGYTGLRLLTEVSDLKDEPSILRHWPGYELRADLMMTSTAVTAVCAYDAATCRGSTMELLRSLHPTAHGSFLGESMFKLHATPAGGLALGGEIDFACAEAVAGLARAATHELTTPILDVGALVFVDVAGMRAVGSTLQAMSSTFSRVRIEGASPIFRRLWDLMALDRLVAADLA